MKLMDLHAGADEPREPRRNAEFADELGPANALRELVGQIGREVAAPLAAALERVNAFANTGRIDRSGLRALRDEIECAQRIALGAQQISRFASSRVRQHPQRLNLSQQLRDALAQRARETASRGIDLRQDLEPAEVIIDASMLSALLQGVLDWSFEHARSHIEFRIALKTWPVHARLACQFAYNPADERPAHAQAATDGARLDTLAWQLVRRLAQTLGLVVQRSESAGTAQLTLEFPNTVDECAATLSTLEFDDGPSAGPNSQPMVGRHVLVIASRRETRNSVRETLIPMGLMVDCVATLDEAREFCSGGLPHGVIFESALAGGNFCRLRADWSRDAPSLAFVEISEQGREIEVSDLGGQRTARVGRDVIVSALPGALMLELARHN